MAGLRKQVFFCKSQGIQATAGCAQEIFKSLFIATFPKSHKEPVDSGSGKSHIHAHRIKPVVKVVAVKAESKVVNWKQLSKEDKRNCHT